jgi:hypothetical protein
MRLIEAINEKEHKEVEKLLFEVLVQEKTNLGSMHGSTPLTLLAGKMKQEFQEKNNLKSKLAFIVSNLNCYFNDLDSKDVLNLCNFILLCEFQDPHKIAENYIGRLEDFKGDDTLIKQGLIIRLISSINKNYVSVVILEKYSKLKDKYPSIWLSILLNYENDTICKYSNNMDLSKAPKNEIIHFLNKYKERFGLMHLPAFISNLKITDTDVVQSWKKENGLGKLSSRSDTKEFFKN